MTERLKNLYSLEIEQARLNFEADPAYRDYLTQSQALWEDQDMPDPISHLLDTSNFLSFVHGFRLGLELGRWAEMGTAGRSHKTVGG